MAKATVNNSPRPARKGPAKVQTDMAPDARKGAPLERHGTTSGSPGKMVSYANRWRENYNPLRQLSIAIAVSLLERGQRGDMALLQWTFRFIERRYPTLSALISRCEAPLMSFDWDIKIKKDLPPGATPEMAAAQQKTLEDAYNGVDNLRDAIKFLAQADFRGYAHLQKHYSPDGDVVHLETLHQWCIARDGLYGDWFWNPDSRSMTMPAVVVGEENRIGGEQLPLEDFIIRTVERPIDEIGLVNFVRSNLCEKDWDGFIEIYGIPGGVVTMPDNVPPGKESEYESAAKMVAEGGAGAIPFGSSYAANDGPRGVDPFTPRMKHLDEQLIMAGTGGKLTMLTESGSGTLAGNAHADTFQAIAEGRAQQITECFQRQFDAGVLADQHAGEPALVYFELAAKDETDVAALVKDIVSLAPAGYKADREWLEDKTGYEFADEAEPLPGAPEPEPEKPLLQNRHGKILNGDYAGHPFHGNQWTEESFAAETSPLRKKSMLGDEVAFRKADGTVQRGYLSWKKGDAYEVEHAELIDHPSKPGVKILARTGAKTDVAADKVRMPGKGFRQRDFVQNRAASANIKPEAKFAAAVADDLAPVLARLQAISEIQDDEIFERKLRQFHADFPQLKLDTLKDPSADRALLPIITQAFIKGLTTQRKAAA